MSGIVVFVRPAAAWILTDTLAYYETGDVAGHRSKVQTYPDRGFVIAMRGGDQMLTALPTIANLCNGFDHAAESIPLALREIQKTHPAIMGTVFELHCSGWSERQQAMAACVITPQNNFTASAIESYVGPIPDKDALERVGVYRNGFLYLGDDPEPGLLAVAQLQHEMVGEPRKGHGGPVGHYVGGAAVLTKITRDEITQRVLRRWDDNGPLRAPSAVAA